MASEVPVYVCAFVQVRRAREAAEAELLRQQQEQQLLASGGAAGAELAVRDCGPAMHTPPCMHQQGWAGACEHVLFATGQLGTAGGACTHVTAFCC